MTAVSVVRAQRDPHAGVGVLLGDIGRMVARCLRLEVRDIEALLMGVVLPVMLMLLFTYVFGGAMDVGGAYLDYVTPGIVLLCAGFGASTTAVAVAGDVHGGMVDRLRSMPVAGWTLLAGHTIASVLRNAVPTTIVFTIAVLLGFRAGGGLTGWIGAAVLVMLWVIAITWVAVFVGVAVRSVAAANGFTFGILFLPYLSSAFVPTASMPDWLRGFAEHQPVTPVIEAVRGLLASGTPPTGTLLAAVAWSLGIAVGFAIAAALVFARRGR